MNDILIKLKREHERIIWVLQKELKKSGICEDFGVDELRQFAYLVHSSDLPYKTQRELIQSLSKSINQVQKLRR